MSCYCLCRIRQCVCENVIFVFFWRWQDAFNLQTSKSHNIFHLTYVFSTYFCTIGLLFLFLTQQPGLSLEKINYPSSLHTHNQIIFHCFFTFFLSYSQFQSSYKHLYSSVRIFGVNRTCSTMPCCFWIRLFFFLFHTTTLFSFWIHLYFSFGHLIKTVELSQNFWSALHVLIINKNRMFQQLQYTKF